MPVFSLKDKSVVFKCVLLLVALIIAFLLWPDSPDGKKEAKESEAVESGAVAEQAPADAEAPAATGEAGVAAGVEDIGAQEDFFALYRTERQKQRSEREELYREILADDSLTSEEKQEAKADLENLYYHNGLEDKLETILKARNYQDVVFSYEEPLSLLIIKANSLSETDEAALREFVAVYCGMDAGSLSIFTVS